MSKFGFYLVVIALSFFWIFPVALMFSTSVADAKVYFDPERLAFFNSFTLDHWAHVFSKTNVIKPIFTSLSTAILSTAFTLLITLPAAYAISHQSQKIVYGFLIGTFVFRMLPEVSVALPLSISFTQLGLFDSLPGIVLAHTVRAFPLAAWILVNTMRNIPGEISKAARIDGSNYWQLMTKVIIPVSKPGIVIAGIFAFLSSWEEFTYASYLLVTNKTLPLEVFYHVNRSGWFVAATYSVVVTVPVMIATFMFQRHLTADYLSGSVKG